MTLDQLLEIAKKVRPQIVEVDMNAPLVDQGFDSLDIVELIEAICEVEPRMAQIEVAIGATTSLVSIGRTLGLKVT